MSTYVYMCGYVRSLICVCVWVGACIYVCSSMNVDLCGCIYICKEGSYLFVCVLMYMYVYTYVYMYTDVSVYIHMWVCGRVVCVHGRRSGVWGYVVVGFVRL